MAARLDTTVKKTGTQKRDLDYVAEYTGIIKDMQEGSKAADASGTAFDEGAFLGKVKKQLEVDKVRNTRRHHNSSTYQKSCIVGACAGGR
jgi:hypothetical protein